MELLTKLGVDSTFFYQFFIFCFAYIVLTRTLFAPYLKAYNKRREVTSGNQEVAENLNAQSHELHIQYEAHAKEMNTKVQSYYELANKEALAIQASMIEKARKEAEAFVQKTRQETQHEADKARAELKKLIPDLGQEIQRKVLSREV
jgi:F0F1-type ATP synthase membrane subunit b/b'